MKVVSQDLTVHQLKISVRAMAFRPGVYSAFVWILSVEYGLGISEVV
jgi:hypothetical protein